jgi:hypothetical protein
LRKATPQKKTLRRSKKSPRMKMCVAYGLSVCGAQDYPVHQEPQPQRLVPGGTRREDHRTVQCEVRTVRCKKVCAPTVTCSDRPMARRTGQGTVRSLVHHMTVRCTTGLSGVTAESSNFPPTATFVLGAINTPQPAISMCGSPRDIPRHIVDIPKCSYTQVLNRITW